MNSTPPLLRKIALSGILGLLAVSTLQAQDIQERWGVGGALGYGDLFSPRRLAQGTKGDVAGTGWIRYGVGPNTETILALDSLSTRGSSRTGSKIRALTLGLHQPFFRPDLWAPYFTLAAGGAFTRQTRLDGKEGVQPTFKIGLGIERALGAQSALGLQWSYHQVLSSGRYARGMNGHMVTASWTYFFYCGAFRAPLPTAVPAADTTPVYARPTAVVEPDGDKDGVPDLRDNCPDTAAGDPVDAFGCPRDSDGDGVVDSLDTCPDTPAGTLVNGAGCPAETVSFTLDIKFDSGRTELKSEFDPQLQKVADFLNRFPTVQAVVEGHTDNLGAPATNRRLSQQRADAVRRALIERFSVAPTRLTAQGFGSDKPLANNATPEGRAANRRVVVTLSAVDK